MPRIPEAVAEKILQAVEKDRQKTSSGKYKRVAIGRRLLFKRHCGERMIRVNVFYHDGNPCPTHKGSNEYNGADEIACVCPDCPYHYPDVDNFSDWM